jgi:hypothetical protein
MRRFLVAASIFAFVGLAAICFTSAAPGAFHQGHAGAPSAGDCTTKHCPSNTHCCYGCTGSPICVKNGVPCPECAPQ